MNYTIGYQGTPGVPHHIYWFDEKGVRHVFVEIVPQRKNTISEVLNCERLSDDQASYINSLDCRIKFEIRKSGGD